MVSAHHGTCTYGRLLGPCYKTGGYGPLHGRIWLERARGPPDRCCRTRRISPLPGPRPKGARVSPNAPWIPGRGWAGDHGEVAPQRTPPLCDDARGAGVTRQRRRLPARRKSKESPVHTPLLRSLPGDVVTLATAAEPEPRPGLETGRLQGIPGGGRVERHGRVQSLLPLLGSPLAQPLTPV